MRLYRAGRRTLPGPPPVVVAVIGGPLDMLTLCVNSNVVPMGLVPLNEIARLIRVDPAMVADWCKDGTLQAERHSGGWWARVDELTSFLERSQWVFVAAPGGRSVGRFAVIQSSEAVASVLETPIEEIKREGVE